MTKEQIIEELKSIKYPGFSRDIVSFGMVKDILINNNHIEINFFNNSEFQKPLSKALQFYEHEHDWSNRLIAGDSLLVMNSLIAKESMTGKIQTIFMDPPYGINYKSNFQPFFQPFKN